MRSQYDVYSANTGVGKHDSHTGEAEHVRPHMRFLTAYLNKVG